MSRKKESKYVTLDDCARFRAEIRGELQTIKNALVGEDLRGGIVKDLATLRSTLESLQKSLDDMKGSRLSGKEKAAIISAVIMALGSIIATILSHLL